MSNGDMVAEEPPVGALVIEDGGDHQWDRGADGSWGCGCGDDLRWTWPEILDDMGNTGYEVFMPRT